MFTLFKSKTWQFKYIKYSVFITIFDVSFDFKYRLFYNALIDQVKSFVFCLPATVR